MNPSADFEGLEEEGAEYELPDDQEEELDSSKPTGWLNQSLDPERMVNGRAEVWKVLKQIHPETDIHEGALELLVQLVQHCGDQLSLIGIELASTSTMEDHLVITSREIQTAVRLMFPGELAKHAVSEGTKAVTKYSEEQRAAAQQRAVEQRRAADMQIEYMMALHDNEM